MPENIIHFLKTNVNPEFFKNTLFYTKDFVSLSEDLLDEMIIITHAIPFLNYVEAHENTKRYLGQDEIFPFLDTLGGQLVCIGYGKQNEHMIYYFDSEFGIFPLEVNYQNFCHKLEKANFDWLV